MPLLSFPPLSGDSKNNAPTDSVDLEFMSEVDQALRYRGTPWAYRLSLLLIVAFTGFLLWINLAHRNEVTRGEGQITPSLGVQPVQSESGGIVKEIFVIEGQEVKKGDRLAQMSNIEAVAEYQDLLNKQVECRLSLKRLDAEANGTPLFFTAEETAAYAEMVEDQLRLFAARKEKLEGGAREIQANLEQKRLAVAEALGRKSQYEQTLLLSKERADRVSSLVREGKFSEIEYLNMRSRVISLEGELNTLAETISRNQSEVLEEEARLANRDSEWRATIAAERNDYRRQLDSITQRITAGSHLVRISDLRAPINGVVRRVLLKEESVAQRAESIMELLPTDDTLEVDARFRPADRGFLEVGMNATIKVDAYDFTIYGGLPASVVRISPDTIEDAKGQAWYEVRLQTDAAKLYSDSQELEMMPGMTVKVDVISGRKSIFDYLLKPILKSRQAGTARGHATNAPAQGAAPLPANGLENAPEAEGNRP
ncbi:MAG: HlyD family type I secretion periplasmic adaptor subunit [Desulfovibrio sp.]|nr:HlyD family type I secretion periplasmic adaptor subunit [Desulfovibrio sp.]